MIVLSINSNPTKLQNKEILIQLITTQRKGKKQDNGQKKWVIMQQMLVLESVTTHLITHYLNNPKKTICRYKIKLIPLWSKAKKIRSIN